MNIYCQTFIIQRLYSQLRAKVYQLTGELTSICCRGEISSPSHYWLSRLDYYYKSVSTQIPIERRHVENVDQDGGQY